jgi:hypothetical protein
MTLDTKITRLGDARYGLGLHLGPFVEQGQNGGRGLGAVLHSGGVEVFYCGLTRRRTTAKATSPEATSASAAGKASEVPPVSGRGFAEALAVALALAEAAAPPAALSSTKRTCRLSAYTVPTAKAL